MAVLLIAIYFCGKKEDMLHLFHSFFFKGYKLNTFLKLLLKHTSYLDTVQKLVKCPFSELYIGFKNLQDIQLAG